MAKPDIAQQLKAWQSELRQNVETIARQSGDNRDAIEQYNAVMKALGDDPTAGINQIMERISQLEVQNNRSSRYGGGRGGASNLKSVGAYFTGLPEYQKSSKSGGARGHVAIRQKFAGGVHRALRNQARRCMPWVLNTRDITDLDVSGMVFTFQDMDTIAKLKLFNRPFLRAMIPSVRLSTDSYEYTARTALHHLSQLITSTANSGQPDVILNNANGVVVGSEVTLSPGEAEEETLIVLSVNKATNTVTMTTNLTQTHTGNASKLVSAQFHATEEGQTKPTSQEEWEKRTGTIKTLATTMTISRQSFDDAPRFEDEINQDLPDMMQRQFDYMALYGKGGDDEFLGVFEHPDVTQFVWSTDGFAGDQHFDAIRRALTLQSIANRDPELIHISPRDHERFDLTKTADKQYIDKLLVVDGQLTMWRVAVMEDRTLKDKDFVIANWSRGAKIYDRQEANLMMSSEHADYFARNLIFLRFEERLDLALREPAAFVAGKLDAAPV